MKNIYRMTCNIVVLVLLMFSMGSFANQADVDAEKSDFIKAFSSGDWDVMKASARKLEGSGYSDPAIFDLIEKQILANLNSVGKGDMDAIAWLVSALGFSGNTKYTETLMSVSKNGPEKLKRYAQAALNDIGQYEARNLIISKDLDKAPAGKLAQQRALNLLHSGDYEMIHLGVKKIYDNFSEGANADTELLNAVQERLLATYKADATNGRHQDNLAWMCKTLANSHNAKYLNAVKEVAENAESVKLKKYAGQSVAAF